MTSFVAAFKAVMNEFGFVVLGWDPSTGEFAPGDAPTDIWSAGPPPVPCRVVAASTRQEWIQQSRFLIDRGLVRNPPRHMLNPAARMKYSRVSTD